MTNKNLNLVAALVVLGSAGLAQAQIRPAYSYPGTGVPAAAPGPLSVQVGDTPLFIAPYIGLGVGHDDNLFQAPTNKKSSTLYVTSPGFKVDARSAASVFQFNYAGQIGRYTDSEDDNYFDNTARAQYDMAFG